MGEVDCLTDLDEESQAAGYVQVSVVAVFVDMLTFDVVHREVGSAIFRCSRFRECGDIWVLRQCGLKVNLVLESLQDDVFSLRCAA